MLAVIFGLGFFSFIGFVYCAIRVQSRKWWAIASVSSVLTLALWVVTFTAEQVDGKTQISDAAAVYYLLLWVGSIVAGFRLNRDYLGWRAGQTVENAWYNQGATQATLAPPPTAGSAHYGAADVAAPQGFLGVDNRQYYAPPPPMTYPQPPLPPSTQPSVTPSAPAKVDVNSASTHDLTLVLGDSDLAHRIVTARLSCGGFQDLNDLGALAGLQPHQLAKVLEKVDFGPAGIRRAPQPQRDSNAGRILDF